MRTTILSLGLLPLLVAPARAVDPSVVEHSIARGVQALKASQQADGTWSTPYSEIGGTALAGLTLLECGVDKKDKVIQAAAKAVREACLSRTTTQTYSLSLSLLFLDRLDLPSDTPLIESLVVRLLAGQQASGGWTYRCPPLSDEEIRRLRAEINPERELSTGRNLSSLPAKGKRSPKDLPTEIIAQLQVIDKGAFFTAGSGDNSNTQFATLALWVGRRYGIPTQQALIRCDKRFRATQNLDGGWSYSPSVVETPRRSTSTAAMTCAGLLALACGHGATLDIKKAKDPKAPDKRDLSKDSSIKAGLTALSTAVGNPLGWKGDELRPPAVALAHGRAYYYLWSLERVAVILGLETIGKKDWYNWGAEILLASQHANGTWTGEYGPVIDSCFAMLFLKKANLARDLSAGLVGLKGSERLLRSGSLKDDAPIKVEGIGPKNRSDSTEASTSTRTSSSPTITPAKESSPSRTIEKPLPKATTAEEKAAVQLGEELVRQRGEARNDLLRKLRDSKGVAYTETLVWSISKLDGEDRRQARVALAERFTRLKDSSLRQYLKDDELEIRRAAALAVAARGSKVLIPDLIQGLSDPEDLVQHAAHTALKELTGKDFGPAPGANLSQRKQAIAAWLKWWKEHARE